MYQKPVGFTVNSQPINEPEISQNNQPYGQVYMPPNTQFTMPPVVLQDPIAYQLWKSYISANIDIVKKEVFSNININENAAKAKERADINSLREMQTQKIVLDSDGSVNVVSIQFGGKQKGTLPVKVRKAILYKAQYADDADILYFQVEAADKRKCEIYLCMDCLKNCQTNQAFDRVGISLGFKGKKETEIRKKLVSKIIEQSQTIELPQKHGWYKKSDEWCYAYPDELTWKEAMKCAYRS